MHILRVVVELDAEERRLVPLALFDGDDDTRILVTRTIIEGALGRVGFECLLEHAAKGTIMLKPTPRYSLSLNLEKLT